MPFGVVVLGMIAALKNKEINWWKIAFAIFVAGYALLIVIKPNLGPENDFMFLRTLQAGKPLFEYKPNFLYYNLIKDGRFMPLGTIEYNLVGFFSKSPSPFWYNFIRAVQYILFAVLFVKILSKFTSNKFLIYITPVFLSLTPGIILPWLSNLDFNERSLMLYFTIFLFFYLQYLEKPKLYYLIFGVISANLALYSKENAFLALGAFAFFHLLFSRKDNKAKIFDGVVLLSSISYALIYFFYVFLPYKGLLIWNSTNVTPPFTTFIKGIFNSVFFIDPIMMLIVLPLIGWRLYRILIKREGPEVIYDSLLFAVPMFLIPLFVMNLFFDFHYFIPMYIFAILPLFYFIPKIWNGKLIWKILAFTIGFLIFFNILPLSLYYLTYSKYLPINFNKTLDFMVNEVKSKSPKRPSIFLDGMDRCGAKMTYFIYSEFLLYKGLTAEQFDLKAGREETPDCFSLPDTKISADKFTVFHKGSLPKISKGDYLIVLPISEDDTKNSSNDVYLNGLSKDYDLIFKTESPLAFPMLNLKEIIRYFLLIAIGPSSGQKLFGIINIRPPIMRWPDYYVFIKR